MHGVLRDVDPEVVRFAVGDSRLDAAARHPEREGVGMVIALRLFDRERLLYSV